ncbi:hypothetical protein TVAG_092190 [Trichomonas vaginalis G3]|uniref:Sugar phosphate transporter domain-containing protein n=1 Tax=Trichomonas vaginalis (strain ATCC PRA-98 / G3) TaxID=412133 RepID=A2FWH6_TRIV3|nr:carbohydrate transport [Trichomonas vaginalis G3]EAX90746.1 hypothetical protein TVAG_092190 [Trichomonas vaginalis G3]KAI5515765.1 carbohydrate transport [Trichomonas vaginalis G3]|eukprot:XP_001303676.1 hypothetical protein [Trichomonas vaginalis G3]
MANKAFLVRFFSTVNVISTVVSMLLLRTIANYNICKLLLTILAFQYLTGWLLLELLAYNGNFSRFTKIPLSCRLFFSGLLFLQDYIQSYVIVETSVGMVQFSKSLGAVTLFIYDYLFKSKKRNTSKLPFLLLFVFGTFIASFKEIEFSLFNLGTIIFACFLSAYTNNYASDLAIECSVSGTQITLSILPFQFIFSIISSILFESNPNNGFYSYQFGLVSIVLIVCSSFTAVWCVLSHYSVIIETSPLHFEFLGAFKTIFTLLLLYFIPGFQKLTTVQYVMQIVGSTIAMIAYGLYMRSENQVLLDSNGMQF